MPACLTHYIFAKNISSENKFKNVFYLGAQGPDVFYFYGYGKKRKNTEKVREFGRYLHKNDISNAYDWLYKYALKYGGANKEMLKTYIKGMFCHYVLDKNAHPYIYYRSGFPIKSDERVKYQYLHALFESRLDTLVAKQYKSFIKPKKILKVQKQNALAISRMFYVLASNYLKFEGIDEFSFYRAYKDMISVTSFLFSKSGFKNILFKMFFNKNLIFAMSAPRKVKDVNSCDYFNNQKHDWLNPVTGEKCDLSFDEICQNARKDYFEVLEILQNYADNKNAKKQLAKFINEITHEGFKVGAIKTHFNLLWWKL